VKEDEKKLSCLIQHRKAATKDAVENCLMLTTEDSYKEAQEILVKDFGQKHTYSILIAFIEKVLKGLQIGT